MSQDSIKVVFGTAGALFTDDTAPEIYKILQDGGVKTLDTAQLYQGKEEVIGRTEGAKKFIVDTKEFGGFKAKTATKDGVIQRGQESIKSLATDQVCCISTASSGNALTISAGRHLVHSCSRARDSAHRDTRRDERAVQARQVQALRLVELPT